MWETQTRLASDPVPVQVPCIQSRAAQKKFCSPAAAISFLKKKIYITTIVSFISTTKIFIHISSFLLYLRRCLRLGGFRVRAYLCSPAVEGAPGGRVAGGDDGRDTGQR